MNEANGKRFRSKFGGFNRDDVNNYIMETDLRHAEEIEALKKDAEAAAAETAQIRERTLSLESELEGLREAAAESGRRAQELDAELASLRAELGNRDAALGEKNALLEEKNALLAEKEAALAAKSGEFDDAKAEWDKELKFSRGEANAKGEEIVRLIGEIDALKAKLAEAEDAAGRTCAAEEEAGQLRQKFAQKDKEVADVKTYVLDQLEQLKAAKQREIDAAYASVETEVERRLQETRGSVNDKGSDAYKLSMYDKISSQLGDILINANRGADELLTEAKTEAEKLRTEAALDCEQKRRDCDADVTRIRAETEAEASYIRDRISQTASELLSAVSSDLHGSVENCIRELTTCIKDMEYEIKTLLTKLGGRSDEMDGLIAYYQNCVTEGIEEKLRAMDEKYGIKPAQGAADHA